MDCETLEPGITLLPPSAAERYLNLTVLGHGGMGSTFKAWDEEEKEWVAIKMIRSDLALKSSVRNRFRREALLLSQIDHPTIVRLKEIFEEDNVIFFTMELVPGRALDSVLHDRLLAPRHYVELFSHLAEGIEHLHHKGIVHRDIKPANIILSEGEPKLVDFGTARPGTEEILTKLTEEGALVGTLVYMPPEAIAQESYTKQCDIYQLGVSLYQCLTGKLPFTPPQLAGIASGEQVSVPLPPSQHNEIIDAELDLLVMRTMAPQPKERFETIEMFQRRCDLWLLGHRENATFARKKKRVKRSPLQVTLNASVPSLSEPIAAKKVSQQILKEPRKLRHESVESSNLKVAVLVILVSFLTSLSYNIASHLSDKPQRISSEAVKNVERLSFVEVSARAKRGDVQAQTELGDRLFEGDGVEQNLEQALVWYGKAAEKGSYDALERLGDAYFYGYGASRDYGKAADNYEKAMAFNDYAKFKLGVCFLEGKGRPADPPKACLLFEEAAKKGILSAQYRLGCCLLDGLGVEKNVELAKKWLVRAASLGYSDAMVCLGRAYEKGQFGKVNLEKARKWYRRATDGEIPREDALKLLQQLEEFDE